jgi:NTE family protein
VTATVNSGTTRRGNGLVAAGWKVRCAAVALGLSLALPGEALGQTAVDSPRIVLVLSGGGARGVAHVGVLAALEEMRVPVHGVVGTSMGAVVGGLWASGLSARDLERILADIDWPAVFRDDVPRGTRAFRRKEEDRRLLLRQEVGIAPDGLRAPAGLVPGHRLSLLLQTLLAPVLPERDFDRLPIPFRATATDLETGQAVVLRSGSLAHAIRASMSVPAAFTPVEREGRLLVDGGLVSNLPLGVARELDPDVIIAVDAGSDPMPRHRLTSVLGVAAQVTRLMVRENSDRALQVSPPDLLLEPDLSEYTSADFPESGALANRGHDVAWAAAETLRHWSVSESTYVAWREGVERRRAELPVPAVLRVVGPDQNAQTRLEEQLDSHVGIPLNVARLEEDLNRIYGLGLYEHVGFDLIDEGPRTVLLIHALPKATGPAALRFGLALADDLAGRGRFTVALQFRHQAINRRGGELRIMAALGEDRRLRGEFHQPLATAMPTYLQAELGHRRRSILRDVDNERILYTSRRTGAGLSAGMYVGTAARMSLGYSAERVVTEAADSRLLQFQGWQSDLTLGLDLDLLDDAALPRRGLLLRAELVSSAPVDSPGHRHERAYGEIMYVGQLGRSVLTVGGAGGAALRGTVPSHDRFELGGLLRLSGIPPGTLSGNELALGRLGLFRPIGDWEVFRIGGVVEAGDVRGQDESWTLEGVRVGITGLLSARMFWGTAHAAIGVMEGGDWAAYLFIGHVPW